MKQTQLAIWLLAIAGSLVVAICAENEDFGRAKAKISAEEMLKLHRKRRDDDKLFSLNSPRQNEDVRSLKFRIISTLKNVFDFIFLH